jgi:NAD(P)-dependent dehydrogenase (short-subunit alcohol dehydrogenase family)
MRDLTGRVAVITGAGSGFGRALAVRLAAERAIPVLLDRDPNGLAETAAMLDGATVSHVLDVRDGAAMQAIADSVQERFGRIDIMINNAGMISRAESFLEMDEAHARLVFEVNYWGVNHGCRAFAPYLARQTEAALVNVASSMGACGCPLHSAYCASKAAVISYTEVLRQELRGSGIAVTVVLPGAAKTNLGRNIPIEDAARKEQAVKNFERFARTTPQTVADKIVRGIKAKRHSVTTGIDGTGLVWLTRHFPRTAHRTLNFAYRRSAEPSQFAVLDALARGQG